MFKRNAGGGDGEQPWTCRNSNSPELLNKKALNQSKKCHNSPQTFVRIGFKSIQSATLFVVVEH